MGKAETSDHFIQREDFAQDLPCSATRCPHPPVFLVGFRTQNALVERRYCDYHGRLFAHKNGLALPGDPRAIMDSDLGVLAVEDLRTLQEKVSKEIYRREEIERHAFSFDSIGPAESKQRPYAARLRIQGGGIERYFFALKAEKYGQDKMRVHGRYTTFSGAVVEKRMGPQNGEPQVWARYLVGEDGEEILLGDRHDQNLEASIIGYLQRRIGAEDLAAASSSCLPKL